MQLSRLSCQAHISCKALLVNPKHIIMCLTPLHMRGLRGARLAWLTLPIDIYMQYTLLLLKHKYPAATVKWHGLLMC